MLRRLFILAAVVSLGLPAVRAQEGAASHAAVIQADTLPVLLERLERDPEDIDLLVEICSQYTMRSEFAAIHPYVSRLRRAGAAHDDERALMYADLFSGQSYLLAEGSDSTRIYLDRALIRGRQCEDPVALCRIYNALGIYAVSIETNYFGGIEYFLEAMKYARSASLNRFYLVAQCNLANTYYMRNDPAGLKYAEEVYRLGTEWGYDYLAFGGAVISAYMHYMLGDQNRALEYILRTLPDTDKFGYHTELYSLYANILHAQGDDAGAERYYLMALDHIDQKVVTAAVMTYLSYGTYLNDRGEYARAIPVLRQGIELSERSNNAVHRYKLYLRISEAETALGRYREALDYFKSYHSQADSIFNVERERSINELRVRYDAERQENMLRKSEIDLIRQQRRFQLLLLLLLFAVGISTVVYILYRRKDKMYKQIVRQQYEFLKKEKKAAQPAMAPPRAGRPADRTAGAPPGGPRPARRRTLRPDRVPDADRRRLPPERPDHRTARRAARHQPHLYLPCDQPAGRKDLQQLRQQLPHRRGRAAAFRRRRRYAAQGACPDARLQPSANLLHFVPERDRHAAV